VINLQRNFRFLSSLVSKSL